MKKCLFELHAHTAESSGCGKIPAAEMVRLYREAGYQGMVITDHFAPRCLIDQPGLTQQEKFQLQQKGYYEALKAAQGTDFVVLYGVELRFEGSVNDYLVFGSDPEFWMECPELFPMKLKEFYPMAKANGILIYQAHPFRNDMVVMPPEFVDGYEVFNGNVRQKSRNVIARAWAKLHNKPAISGSDAHQLPDLCRGGIAAQRPIRSNTDLVSVLTSGEYALLETSDGL